MSQVMGNPVLANARLWHHVSAENRTVGKLATRIAQVLMGKHKPTFDRSTDCGDYVVVTNCEKVYISGKKAIEKTYWKQSSYAGNSRSISYRHIMATRPEDIITHAVSRMLPKNKLRKLRLERLKVFQADTNPYASNLIKRYDLSPTGDWSGKGTFPETTTDRLPGAFEIAKAKAGWA
ncbi:ribosomal protein L13-domain-containing protein [Mrakia frigida]|uniref:mitochondrial 54S ribosomal protein uL13m MRPL23 n=1 Tax=Mrakia frigida TaxID=29902 RepID=UPI003FCC1667